MHDSEPRPQNELERLLPKAAQDPAWMGPLFRMLWESELFTFVPDQPEIDEDHELKHRDGFQFVTYDEAGRKFAVVYTSDVAAEFAAQQAPPPAPAIAALPGELLFKLLNNGDVSV